ncbi:MAG: DHH family phosphoesterase, partial [Oscillospiraceae bacterium]|nr:DHH family phosphoesterase [Oscillospiraceae bacterium]
MANKFQELVDLLRGHRVYVQTHNFPDQDAVASAFGLQVLLRHFGIKSTICHHGVVERAVTANMVADLGVEMLSDEFDESNDRVMTEKDYIITVDSQKGSGNIDDLIGDEVACIDHHPTFVEVDDYKYMDVRIVGSCSTIIADYYRECGVEMPENVATALLYGLKCDTRNFTRGVTQLDVDIYQYLFQKSNHQQIRRYQAAEIEYSELNAFSDSLRNIEIYNEVGFAFLNFPCKEGFIATVSDFILDIDLVKFVVVYTRRPNGFKFSVRSELDELDAGKIISEALKDVGSGGGHKTMAGGFAQEDKILAMSIDFNKVIQNLFLNVINT